MNQITEFQSPHIETAEAIVNALPAPDYAINYQPTYPDTEALVAAVAELVTTKGVTQPGRSREFTSHMARIGQYGEGSLVILGGCRERIQIDEPIDNLARQAHLNLELIDASPIEQPVRALRMAGQYKKPRSNGAGVPYMGDVVNGEHPKDRTPEPSRMVAGAVQARDLSESVLDADKEVYWVHEGLLMPYEEAFMREDAETESVYTHSADMLWAGVRTNSADGPIAKMLAKMLNTTGVKIGANTTRGHIAELAAVHNPEGIPGKQVYMLRLKNEEAAHYPRILRAIRDHAPGSVVVWDIHGITKTMPDGTKIRSVSDVELGLELMARACDEASIPFGGVSLESTTQPRTECVNRPGEMPLHSGGIDPQLNMLQTAHVLGKAAVYLN